MASVNTPPVRRIFVVLDPTRLVQPALEKGEWLAARNNAELVLYCAVYAANHAPDSERQQQLVERTRSWIERLIEARRRDGMSVSVNVESKEDWRAAIAAAAIASDADLVIKTASPRGALRRRLMQTSDWILLRNCARPVLLVSQSRIGIPKTVLAAVKLKPTDEVHIELNERVVDLSHRIAELLDAELHAVTVYRGDEIFFDRQRFADACRLPRNRVHAVEGTSYEGIAEAATRLGAGVVIVGLARQPTGGSVVGVTAERVIDEVDADVVVLPTA